MKVKFTNHKWKLHLIDLVISSDVTLAMFDSTGFNGFMGETAHQLDVSILREGVRNLVLQRFKQLHQKVTTF